MIKLNNMQIKVQGTVGYLEPLITCFVSSECSGFDGGHRTAEDNLEQLLTAELASKCLK
jgi:hypothetical protein